MHHNLVQDFKSFLVFSYPLFPRYRKHPLLETRQFLSILKKIFFFSHYFWNLSDMSSLVLSCFQLIQNLNILLLKSVRTVNRKEEITLSSILLWSMGAVPQKQIKSLCYPNLDKYHSSCVYLWIQVIHMPSLSHIRDKHTSTTPSCTSYWLFIQVHFW